MKITPKTNAISRKREDGTEITYYIFNEHEVHYGEIPPGVKQPWHHHEIISETLYVVEGKILLHFLENGEIKQKEITPGNVIQVEKTPHTFSNPFKSLCKMMAFRFIPQDIDQRDIIKNDKVLHPELE